MRRIRVIFYVLIMFLGLGLSVQTVHAQGLGGVNTGKYVYQDQEYITNSQYDQLVKINNHIDRNVSPQKLYILIFKNDEDTHKFLNVTDANTGSYPEQSITNGTGQVLYGNDRYYDIEINDSETMDNENNYLILDLKDNRVFWDPSDFSESYITDLQFLELRLGLLSNLRSSDTDTKVSALFELANRLEPRLTKVSQSNEILKAKTIGDIKNIIGTILFVIGVIIVIILWKKFHNKNKNNHHYGSGDDLGNSDYDAGFDEGYYMGSNDPFM